MRLRWLFGNFVDPDLPLPRREQHAVSNEAHEHHMPTGDFVWWTLLAIVLPMGALVTFGIPLALDLLGLSGSTTAMFVGFLVAVLLTWPLSAFVYGHLYTKAVRRALRDRGTEVCLACGYVLTDLPSAIERCPECGQGRERQPDPGGAATGDD